jgi:WG containing repeat
MKLPLLTLSLIFSLTVSWAQLRTDVGYDCDEELFPRFDKATRTWGYVNMVGVWRVEPTFNKVERYAGKLAVVQKGTKFGLLNCEGRLVAMPVYDEIQNFVNGRGWARQGSLWGLLDDKGHLIVPPAFEDIRPVGLRNELTWVKKRGVWGVFSKDRIKMVVEPRYDACRSISDSLGIGMRAGYMDPIYLGTGQVIYDSCTRFDKATGNNYTFVYNNQWGLMEVTGTVLIRPEYDTIKPYKNYLTVKKTSSWAMASLSGKFVTGFEYEDVKGTNYTLLAARKNGKWGYLLPNGKTYVPFDYIRVIPQMGQYYSLDKGTGANSTAILKLTDKLMPEDFKYSSASLFDSLPIALLQHDDSSYTLKQLETGLEYPERVTAIAQSEDSFWLYPSTGSLNNINTPYKRGIVNARDFRRYLPLSLDDFYLMGKEPFLLVGKSQTQTLGLMDIDTKKIIIPKEHKKLEAIKGTNSYVAVKGDMVFVYNEAGKQLVSLKAEDIVDYYKPGVYSYKKDDKYGVIQAPNKVILQPEFTQLSPSGTVAERAGLPFIAKRKKGLFLLNGQGDKITEEYDSLKYVGNGTYAAASSDAFRLFDKNGKSISPLTYEHVWTYAEGLLLVKEKGMFMFLNKALKPAFKLEIEEATPFDASTARVKMRGRWYLINKQGRVVQILPN